MGEYYCKRPILLALGGAFIIAQGGPSVAQTQSRTQMPPPIQSQSQSQVQTQPQPTPQTAPRPALDLKARDIRRDRNAEAAQSLTIANLDIQVKIAGGLVETSLIAEFYNPSSSVLEGDFTLDLPRNAFITGFGLDVNGVMIDGVLQPKAKATEAYEENLRRGVDPGLGEINDANQFRTRIFPINPRASRTVKITYVSALDDGGGYSMPLSTAGSVGQVKLEIAINGPGAPSILVPNGLTPSRSLQALRAAGPSNQTSLVFEGQGIKLDGGVRVTYASRDTAASILVANNGERYFTFNLPPAPITAAKPNIVRVYWDSSRSRRDDELAKEIALLEEYVRQVAPARLDLVLFADEAARTISFTPATLATLANQLRGIRYQGASRFGNLERVDAAPADMCLIFSDGQLSMGAFSVRPWPCRVMTISTSANARRDILEGIASANRGLFVDLKAFSVASSVVALQSRGPDLRTLTDQSGSSIDYSVTAAPDGGFKIIGPLASATALVVQTYTASRTLTLADMSVANHNGAAAFWGASEIKRLSATDNPDTDRLLAAVRRFSVATPDYSYIVLETVDDYARNNITPSLSVGKDFLTQYQARRTQIEASETAARSARFADISNRWNEQKTWWKTRFPPVAQRPQQQQQNRNLIASPAAQSLDSAARPQDSAARSSPASPPPPPPPPLSRRLTAPTPVMAAPRQERDSEPEPAPGNANERTIQGPAPTTAISVTAAPWNPDRPYLTALSQVKRGETAAFDTIYAAQEARYGNTPAFYFDMAEWAFRNGFEGKAAAIGNNALELPSTSVDTKIILASRLVRYGGFDEAIWLSERILLATPNKPQALRNLALAITAHGDARNKTGTEKADIIADYERALGLLMKIVLTPNNGDYDGIELIALMEANRLVPKLKALGVSDARINALIDPRLIALLSVDIRVTLEWNTDKTDMDLWVDEPGGERAIYSNPRTAIGGRLSNDMTRGYGPEEYLLNVAPNGTYSVKSNAFAPDQLNPNGPTSLTVKLFRNWGRDSEQVESFVVELKRGDANTVEVGRFVKGPVRPPTR
jgi:hypothetical protein